MNRVLWAAIGAFILFFAGRADAKPTTRTIPLSFDDARAIVAGAAPSADHPSGTALVYGTEDEGADRDALVAIEVDLARGDVVQRSVVDVLDGSVSDVNAVRVGDDVVIAVTRGYENGSIVVFTTDITQHVRDRVTLEGDGAGREVSLAVDEHTILVGSFERREPVIPRTPVDGWAPSCVLHVRAIDRATGCVAGARVFRGNVLLTPKHQRQVLAIAHGVAVVGLPMMNEVRISTLSLPALRDLHTMDIAVDRDPEPGIVVGSVGDGIGVKTPGEWLELDRDLVVRRRVTAYGGVSMFQFEPGTGRALVDGELPPKTLGLPMGNVIAMAWAWGSGVGIEDLRRWGDEDAHPKLVIVR